MFFENTGDEHEISEYGAGIISESDAEEWEYYGINYETIDTVTGVIRFPKDGEISYDIDLSTLNKDIYGNELVIGEEYEPVVLGFGDRYYRDLPCVEFTYSKSNTVVTLSAIPETEKIKIIQSNTSSFFVDVQDFIPGNFIIEIRTITDDLVFEETISSVHQLVSVSGLPDGIYIANVKENGILTAASKIILQK